MEIHNKRGVWFVIEPGREKRIFDSEEKALAYVNGEDLVVDADLDDDLDYDIDDDEYYEK
jgi:hypothetical protein